MIVFLWFASVMFTIGLIADQDETVLSWPKRIAWYCIVVGLPWFVWGFYICKKGNV